MRTLSKPLSAAVVMALLCPLIAQRAEAQWNNSSRAERSERVEAVQILVREIGTRREIARLDPGDTLSLPEGSRVRINVMVLSAGSSNPRYPATEITDNGRGGTRITRTNEENAAADLEIVRSRNSNRLETIRYRITESWVPSRLRTGSFTVQVGPEGSVSGGVSWSSDRARDLTRRLYQGILMREPDQAAASTTRAIQEGGLDALAQAARNLAASDESRIRIYDREGVCNEQRLMSLYKNLLGISSNQIERRQWDEDLDRLRDGDIDGLVEDMVRSDWFRSRYTVSRR